MNWSEVRGQRTGRSDLHWAEDGADVHLVVTVVSLVVEDLLGVRLASQQVQPSSWDLTHPHEPLHRRLLQLPAVWRPAEGAQGQLGRTQPNLIKLKPSGRVKPNRVDRNLGWGVGGCIQGKNVKLGPLHFLKGPSKDAATCAFSEELVVGDYAVSWKFGGGVSLDI